MGDRRMAVSSSAASLMIALAAGALGQDAGPTCAALDIVLGPCSASGSIVQVDRLHGSTTALRGWRSPRPPRPALLATVGLTLHEMTTERVVHELSVISGDERLGRHARVS